MTKSKTINIKLNVFILGEKSIESGSTASQAACTLPERFWAKFSTSIRMAIWNQGMISSGCISDLLVKDKEQEVSMSPRVGFGILQLVDRTYSWLLNMAGVKGTIQVQIYCPHIQSNLISCRIIIYIYWKNTYKWIHIVQNHLVQGSTVPHLCSTAFPVKWNINRNTKVWFADMTPGTGVAPSWV